MPRCISLLLFPFHSSLVKGLFVFETVVASTPSHLTLAVKMINKNVFRFTENVVWTSETFFINDGHRLIKINIFFRSKAATPASVHKLGSGGTVGFVCHKCSKGEEEEETPQAERNGGYLLKRHCSVHASLFPRFRGVVKRAVNAGFSPYKSIFFFTFQLKIQDYH